MQAKCNSGSTYSCQTIDEYIVAQCTNNITIKYCTTNSGNTCVGTPDEQHLYKCDFDISNNQIISCSNNKLQIRECSVWKYSNDGHRCVYPMEYQGVKDEDWYDCYVDDNSYCISIIKRHYY